MNYDIATETMKFEALLPNRVYTTKEITLPKGDPIGKGNSLVMLCPSMKDSLDLIVNKNFTFAQCKYRWYYIDAIYREKIGFKKLAANRHGEVIEAFNNNKKMGIKQILPQKKAQILKSGDNYILDISNWLQYFFLYRKKENSRKMCQDFILFFANHADIESEYDPIYFYPLDLWHKNKKIRFKKKEDMNNPLSILLHAGYQYPELFSPLSNGKFILCVPYEEKYQIAVIPMEYFLKENSSKLKMIFGRFKEWEVELEEEPISKNFNMGHDEDIASAKAEFIQEMKIQILNTVKRNLIGRENDLTNIIEGDEDNISEVEMDEDSITDDEIEAIAKAEKYLDTRFDDEDLTTVSAEDITKEIEDYVKNSVYIQSIMPERTENQKNLIEKLSKDSSKILNQSTIKDLKSQMIDETNFDGCIETNNVSILKSRYVNFNKNYMTKKFETHIDASIRLLEKGEYPLFCTEKIVEDTSDSLNLKYTYTYKLEDMNGKKHSIVIDIPRVIDGQYIHLQGSTKVIGNQIVMKPIVKSGPDEVQLVSWYNKIFLKRMKKNIAESDALLKYLMKYDKRFHVRIGNSILKNKHYVTPLDFDSICRQIHEFRVGNAIFITELDAARQYCIDHDFDVTTMNKNPEDYFVGFDNKEKKPIIMHAGGTFVPIVLKYMAEKDIEEIKKTKTGKNNMFIRAKINASDIPVILFMMYCDGFKETMKKSNIEWHFENDPKIMKDYPAHEWGSVKLNDGMIFWKRMPIQNSLLMNGFQSVHMENFSIEELESRQTWILALSPFFKQLNFSFYLDNFRDFMIDECMEEVLMSYNLPTDLVSLIAYGAKLLSTNSYSLENDMNNARIRCAEIIPALFDKVVLHAYQNYRKTAYKGKRSKSISVNRNAVIQSLLGGSGNNIADKAANRLIEEASSLNPILTLEKGRAVTYKGPTGINEERSLKEQQRGYDQSMLGIMTITTTDDGNTGIVRQLSLEPNITSTLGFLKVEGEENVSKLSSAQLLSPSDMLTPFGIQHDDPSRTSMTYKQSKYMLMMEESDPVLIGNKVESVIAYHMPDEFSVMAEKDGKIIDKGEDFITIQYKDGYYRTVDLSPQVKKNASSGFWISSQFVTNLEKGDIVKRGQAIAWDPKAFSKNKNDLGISMKLGVFTKVAIAPAWDIFEDSCPITYKLSKRMSVDMVDEKTVSLKKTAFVDWMVKIGDHVKTGDPLIRFDETRESDDFMNEFLKGLRSEVKENILTSTMTTIKSKYSGIITDIKVYTSVPLDDIDPSLRGIVSDYHNRLKKKNTPYDQYRNSGDGRFYKSGTIITEIAEIVDISDKGKLKGKQLENGEGVVICFYVKYKDGVRKGDKICAEFALKGIVSHVIEQGLEPYSELHPDEEISYFLSPLAVSARKVPSVFITMFGNKCLVELKRQHLQMWKESESISKKRVKIINHLCTAMDYLDPSGVNAKYYRDKFKAMSDKQFDAFFKAFESDEKMNYYLEIIEFERDLKIDQIEKCAKFMGIPLMETVFMPHINGSVNNAVVTPLPIPVGYINMKRMPQTLLNKTHSSISIDKRNPVSGQVYGEDKNARNSDCETYALLAIGAKEALKEFMGFRADDMTSKNEAYNKISQDGYVVQSELTNDPMNRISLRTLHTYFLMQGIMTNIMKPDKPLDENMKTMPITDKMIEQGNLKCVTNQLWMARNNIPTSDGLFSPDIFGITPKERSSTSAYIDLKQKFFHPFFYEQLTRLCPRTVDKCASGEGCWSIIDGQLKEITDKDSKFYKEENTGLGWLINNFRKIDFRKNDSVMRNKRVDLFTEFKDEDIFITKWIVIPIFYRDFDTSSGSLSIPELNYSYQKLIRYANSISPGEMMLFNNQAMYNIQRTLVSIRKYGQDLIAGKNGALHKMVLGKSVDYGGRAVISVPIMNDAEKSEDLQVDALHAGIPLALCLSTGFPLVIRWVQNFFREKFENVQKANVLRKDKNGNYYMEKVAIGDQLQVFTTKYLEKKIKEYQNTYSARFEPISMKSIDGETVYMVFTGRPFGSTPDSPEASSIASRPMTWTDLFYIAAMESLTDKHVYITRYPLLDYLNTCPFRCMPVSTVKTEPMMVDGIVYSHYPHIDLSMSEYEISTLFIDTVELSNLFLEGFGADYDGDTVSLKIVFSQEANIEAEHIIKHMKNFIHASGNNLRVIGNEPYLTFYAMTKF